MDTYNTYIHTHTYNTYNDFTFNNFTTMIILITLNTGDITYNDVAYN